MLVDPRSGCANSYEARSRSGTLQLGRIRSRRTRQCHNDSRLTRSNKLLDATKASGFRASQGAELKGRKTDSISRRESSEILLRAMPEPQLVTISHVTKLFSPIAGTLHAAAALVTCRLPGTSDITSGIDCAVATQCPLFMDVIGLKSCVEPLEGFLSESGAFVQQHCLAEGIAESILSFVLFIILTLELFR